MSNFLSVLFLPAMLVSYGLFLMFPTSENKKLGVILFSFGFLFCIIFREFFYVICVAISFVLIFQIIIVIVFGLLMFKDKSFYKITNNDIFYLLIFLFFVISPFINEFSKIKFQYQLEKRTKIASFAAKISLIPAIKYQIYKDIAFDNRRHDNLNVAINNFELAYKYNKKDRSIQLALYYLNRDIGNYNKAELYIPNNDIDRDLYIDLRIAEKRYREALEIANRTKKVELYRKDYYRFAVLHTYLNEYEDALDYISNGLLKEERKSLFISNIEDFKFYLLRAYVYSKTGNEQKAISDYEKAIKIEPSYRNIYTDYKKFKENFIPEKYCN